MFADRITICANVFIAGISVIQPIIVLLAVFHFSILMGAYYVFFDSNQIADY